MKIDVKADNSKVASVLDGLIERVSNPNPILKLIGQTLVESTQQRFARGEDPSGAPWADNTFTTLEFFLQEHTSNFKKTGGLSKQGAQRLAGKKPLTGKTKELQTTITSQLSKGKLEVGSPLPYARMHQLGGTTATNSMIPNKDIPARPFLGLSSKDEGEIIELVSDYLLS